METRAAVGTVNVVVPLTVPNVAVMVDVPAATAVASPLVEIVATLVLEESQLADDVRLFVLPSL